MPKTVAAVRQKMLSAWDGVTSLHARARDKYYTISNVVDRNTPRFMSPDDLCIEPYHYEAWWQHPNHWRYDCEIPSQPITLPHRQISYLAIGNSWWVKEDGMVKKAGTVVEAQQTAMTQGESLWFGRPYLSASDNRLLWAWLNPPLWAASMNLIVTDQVDPLPDDVFHDPALVHVLEGW